jgi:hypothetical protein
MVLYVPVNFEDLEQSRCHPLFGGNMFAPWRAPCKPRLSFRRPAEYYWVVGQPQEEEQKTPVPAKDFEAELNLKEFKPEEIKVELRPQNRTLIVSAQQEHEEDGFQMFKNIQRSVYIPEGYNLDAVKAKVNDKGILVVRAEKLEQPKEQEKIENKELPNQTQLEDKQEEMEVEGHEKSTAATEEVVQVEVSSSNQEKEQTVAEAVVEGIMQAQNDDKPASQVDQVVDAMGQEVTKMAAEQESTNTTVAQEQPTAKPFTCSVDVSKFSPEEINVEVTDSGRLRISAKHEEVDVEDGSTSVAQMSKEFTVDAGRFDLNAMKSTLTKDGILTVEAPARVLARQQSLRIPVNVL